MLSNYWQGKSAIISGGSSGLGLELAKVLVDQGISKLLMIGRNDQRLQDAKLQFQTRRDVSLLTLSADVSRPDDSLRLGQFLLENSFGPVDLLVNAVGQSDRGTVLQLTSDRLNELLDANVRSTLLVTQNVFPLLRKPGGIVVNIGSLACLFAPRYLGGYSVAKHALAALTQQMRLEFADAGVHVLLVCPGPIRRPDSGRRYLNLPVSAELPAEALQGGGGAKIKGLCPEALAKSILASAAARDGLLVRPRKARWLQIISAISPKLGDYLLRRMSA